MHEGWERVYTSHLREMEICTTSGRHKRFTKLSPPLQLRVYQVSLFSDRPGSLIATSITTAAANARSGTTVFSEPLIGFPFPCARPRCLFLRFSHSLVSLLHYLLSFGCLSGSSKKLHLWRPIHFTSLTARYNPSSRHTAGRQSAAS